MRVGEWFTCIVRENGSNRIRRARVQYVELLNGAFAFATVVAFWYYPAEEGIYWAREDSPETRASLLAASALADSVAA